MSASVHDAGPGEGLYDVCLRALTVNAPRLKAAGGRHAVIYAGSARGLEVWRRLERRQREWLQKVGIDAPYEMLPECLARLRISVQVGGKGIFLHEAMNAPTLFRIGECDDLWGVASGHWAANNRSLFLWRDFVVPDPKHDPVFDAIELPIWLMRHRASLTQMDRERLARAMDAIRAHGIEKELSAAEEKAVRELLAALERRDAALKRHRLRSVYVDLSRTEH